MTRPAWVHVAFWVFAAGAVVSGWRVFRTDSMVRASFLLLASFLNVGAIMLLLGGEYLGFALFFMMAVEMMVMAIFMVMFMMNPAGLNPMSMVHQHRVAVAAGAAAALILGAAGLLGEFPDRPLPDTAGVTADLGRELLGGSMLVFESVGVTLLAAMVGAVILATHQGRFGPGDADSLPPPLEPGGEERPEDAIDFEGDHGGHGGDGGHGQGGHG